MKKNVNEIKAEIIDLACKEADSYNAMDSKRQNSIADETTDKFELLLGRDDEGKRAIESLLSHDSPFVRGRAAAYARHWNPALAIPVIEDLLAWSSSPERRPAEKGGASAVGMSCKVMLAEHYGIALKDVLPRVLGIREDDRPWM